MKGEGRQKTRKLEPTDHPKGLERGALGENSQARIEAGLPCTIKDTLRLYLRGRNKPHGRLVVTSFSSNVWP